MSNIYEDKPQNILNSTKTKLGKKPHRAKVLTLKLKLYLKKVCFLEIILPNCLDE